MGFLKKIFKKIVSIPKALVKDVGRSIKGSLEGDPMSMVKLATYIYGGYQGMSYLSNSAALSTSAVHGVSGVAGGVGAGSATGAGTVFPAFGGTYGGGGLGAVGGGGAGWGAMGASGGTSFFTGNVAGATRGITNVFKSGNLPITGGTSPITGMRPFQQTWEGASIGTQTYGPAYKPNSFFNKIKSGAKKVGDNKWFKAGVTSYREQRKQTDSEDTYRNLQASYNTNYQKLLAQYQYNAEQMGNRNSNMYRVEPTEVGFAKTYHIPNMGKYLERSTGIHRQSLHAHNDYLRSAIETDFRTRYT